MTPVLLLLLCAGCTPRASEGGFSSPDPASRLYAITEAGEQRDRDAIPRLIELLGSDDPAERMMAIHALERMTGTRNDYDPYALPAKRQVAIERWEQALQSGELGARP